MMLRFVAVPSANKSHVVPRYCCLLALLRSITAVEAALPGTASSERAAATAVTAGAAASMGSADQDEKDARMGEAIQEGRRRCLLTKHTQLQSYEIPCSLPSEVKMCHFIRFAFMFARFRGFLRIALGEIFCNNSRRFSIVELISQTPSPIFSYSSRLFPNLLSELDIAIILTVLSAAISLKTQKELCLSTGQMGSLSANTR